MGSPLSFVNTAGFRGDLVKRNLPPYAKSPSKVSPPINYEYVLSDYSVKDSPDALIDTPRFANLLYRLNKWGAEGGYKQVPDPTGILTQKSNKGEYGTQQGVIIGQAQPKSKEWKSINKYGTGSESVLDSAPFFESLNQPSEPGRQPYTNNQPYPRTFVPSSYSPLSLLLNDNPSGSNGLLSQDSFIARLGARTLRREFEERIAAQIVQDTVGRANIFNADSATDILNIITGTVPLIQPNWTITVPENPILAATAFILRLGGSIIPVSPIPGSYFDDGISMRQPTTVQQLENAYNDSVVGNVVNTLLGTNLTGSEIFYNNTGPGQKSQLFKNLNYNKYKPSFDRTLLNRVAGLIVGSTVDTSTFYVGSNSNNPSRIFSPSREIPINSYGQEVQATVYGPEELSDLYEGIGKQVKLGANGVPYVNGGGIEGGMTWVSPKYRGNAGKKVGVGGQTQSSDPDFKPSSFNSTESTNIEFKQGSILDDTQRIINSQPDGGRRLRHVGNAIDQVSKVFNDGYKEITKGSKVLSYVGEIGQEVGTEYCRVFTKDTPYLQYNDLQKTDGVVTEGRRFSYSVLDKTYNLNIAPNKQEGGQSSTNLINGPGGTSTNEGYAKKYMFSLENLAWRTSQTPGFTVSDLPICERGPNGGRVMWFPPYGLTFSETVSTSWKATTFLGRPEPIYTYENTQRTGSLSWNIVVDHPSVLNLITNKVLANVSNKKRIDSILESFFSGCRKYDLYELAKKYYKVNPNDLLQIQQAINSKEMSKEQMTAVKKTLESGFGSPTTADQPLAPALGDDIFNKYVEKSFYFDNNSPTSVQSYQVEYDTYVSPQNRLFYEKSVNSAETSVFFDQVIIPNYNSITAFTNELKSTLKQTDGTVTIGLKSSCSAAASSEYKKNLQTKRVESVIEYFKSDIQLGKYIEEARLIFDTKNISSESETVVPLYNNTGGEFQIGRTIDCSVNGTDAVFLTIGGDTTGSKKLTTYEAMACRSVTISRIDVKLREKTNNGNQNPDYEQVLAGNTVIGSKKKTVVEERLGDNITKRVLRMLLSECDYFEVMKEETPMVYDNLKDKLKFFQPAFHSTTPEGLNSRLTFLQQCMRPGDTIPTIKESNGAQILQYNNATNTSFGTPPVCILRVGDFFHTKILPDSLQISYENLDLNPEGIGIQPMIAKVTMSFKFVGGQGLKNSIDKLQNALTFNYYANTEMWDDRADVSDESYKVLDKDFLQYLNQTVAPAINESSNSNGQSNNSTIGTILTSQVDTYETGTISYSDFINKWKNETQNYFQFVINKQKEVANQYNNALRQQWNGSRNYTDGGIVNPDFPNIVYLYGKPENVQERINEIFDDLIDDIKDNDDKFITYMSQNELNFSNKVIRQLKENYVNFLNNKKGSYLNAITSITQDIVNMQQNYIQTVARVNTITFSTNYDSGTDGYQQPNGNVIAYDIFGTDKIDKSSVDVTNTYEELIDDVLKVRNDFYAFNIVINSEKQFKFRGESYTSSLVPLPQISPVKPSEVFIPFQEENFANLNVRRQYMLLSDEVTDMNRYNKFKDELIGKILGNTVLIGNGNYEIEKYFDEFWLNKSKPIFVLENDITKYFIDSLEKNDLKPFINYTPFGTKQRIFTFSSQPMDEDYREMQKEVINLLGSSVNYNSDEKTWNDMLDVSEPVFISKVKFN